MKRMAMLLIFALLGLLAITSINQSEVAVMGKGIQFPVGWQQPVEQKDLICSLPFDYAEGLPFAVRRPAYHCQGAENNLARMLNSGLGIVMGLAVGLLVNRLVFRKQRHRLVK